MGSRAREVVEIKLELELQRTRRSLVLAVNKLCVNLTVLSAAQIPSSQPRLISNRRGKIPLRALLLSPLHLALSPCFTVYAPEPHSPLSLPTSEPHSLNLPNAFPHFFKPSSLDSLPRSSIHSPSTRTPQELYESEPSFSNRNTRSTRIRYRFPLSALSPFLSKLNSLFTLSTQVNLI